jgi:hypothetical protein
LNQGKHETHETLLLRKALLPKYFTAPAQIFSGKLVHFLKSQQKFKIIAAV